MKLVETDLKIKSTAALRQEIIKELTQPDKSIEKLIQDSELDDQDSQQDNNRVGQADRRI